MRATSERPISVIRPTATQSLPSDDRQPSENTVSVPTGLSDPPDTENSAWGHWRVQGEPVRLGHRIAASAVGQILHDTGIDPAPRRSGSIWRASASPRKHRPSFNFPLRDRDSRSTTTRPWLPSMPKGRVSGA